MKQKQILSIVFIILMISIGCKKSSTSSDTPTTPSDMAKSIEGTYSGTWNVSGGSVGGKCTVVKDSTNYVDLIFEAGGAPSGTAGPVKTSDGGSGKINLTFIEGGSTTMSGYVQNKTINLTSNVTGSTVTFTGTKP
jgi:hypothetical protein